MEVKNVSTSATSKVGDATVKYTITEKNGKKEVSGMCVRDEETVCYMNWKKDGEMGISFNSDTLTWEEQKSVTEQILADIEQLNA